MCDLLLNTVKSIILITFVHHGLSSLYWGKMSVKSFWKLFKLMKLSKLINAWADTSYFRLTTSTVCRLQESAKEEVLHYYWQNLKSMAQFDVLWELLYSLCRLYSITKFWVNWLKVFTLNVRHYVRNLTLITGYLVRLKSICKILARTRKGPMKAKKSNGWAL